MTDANVSWTTRRLKEPAVKDLNLSPRDVAVRDVEALGPEDACARWASLSSQDTGNTRIHAIVNAVIERCYELAPPLDDRPFYVVSWLDKAYVHLIDFLVAGAPTPTIALMVAMQRADKQAKEKREQVAHIEVSRIDDGVTIDGPPFVAPDCEDCDHG